MLDNFTALFKKNGKKEQTEKSKNAAKERLHLVLMQDRANVSADFLEMMKMEIVDVIKKYIDVDETDMDVKLENRVNDDGTSGAPALYANIPIMGINEEKKKESAEITKAKKAEEDEIKEEKNKLKKEVSAKKATTQKTTVSKKIEDKQIKKVKAESKKIKKDVKDKVKTNNNAETKEKKATSTKNTASKK